MRTRLTQQPREVETAGQPIDRVRAAGGWRPWRTATSKASGWTYAQGLKEFESCLGLATIEWARQGSNLRPTGYEPAALPLSYGPPAIP